MANMSHGNIVSCPVGHQFRNIALGPCELVAITNRLRKLKSDGKVLTQTTSSLFQLVKVKLRNLPIFINYKNTFSV